MEQPQLFLAALRAFTDRVHGVAESQWSAPTPNTEWTVADLVDHLVDEHRWFPPLMHGLDHGAAEEVVLGSRKLPVDGGVGANLAESWDEVSAGSADAVVEPGALERTVELARGATPSADYVAEMTMDLIVHGWDLGVAIGHVEPLPDELVAFGHEQVQADGLTLPSSMFAAPVEVPDDASAQDKMLARTGRDPNWAPA